MTDTAPGIVDVLSMPLDGVQQIEASAGTGKTYTIAGLYARLIIERKLELRQILVMTFTKAATAELRQRLRQRLLLCADLATSLWQDAPLDDALDAEASAMRILLQRALAAGETAQALATRLRLAVLGMDESAILTIHGFCQRVLRDHAALVDGVSGEVELIPVDGDLLEDFAADAWLRLADDSDVLMREALLKLGATPDDLVKKLKQLVDFGGSIEPAAPSAPLPTPKDPDSCRAAIFAAWAGGAADAVTLFEQAFTSGHFLTASFPDGSDEDLRELAAQLAARHWPVPKLLSPFAASQIAAGMKQKAPPFAGHAAFAAIDVWYQACIAREDAVRARVPVVLHRLVDEARIWLRMRKRELARMSYADQIALVHDGLAAGARGQRLLHALRLQYPVALVDEFQDTDARQFDIFARLYRDYGALFCIGDPKQAIYGFRGGDVHAYLRANALASARWRLDHNYRSAPGMLAASAALFGLREDVFIEKGIAFEPVAWGDKVQPDALRHDGQPLPPMTFWQLPDKPIKGGKDVVARRLADACAGQIAQLLAPDASSLNGHPLLPKHIAVLVNTNAQAMWVQDALASHGIAGVCLRRESVFASLEAVELQQVLEALLAPRDARLARGALATRLLGRNLDEVQAMQGADIDWRVELDALRTLWIERGVLAMLERLGEDHAQRLLAQPGGERCLSNLMQLADALQAQAQRLATPHAQRDWLAQRIAQADETNEDEQLRLESDAERVKIMTLHAAKGLEFELVLLPFAALMSAREPGKDHLVRFHHDENLLQRYLGSGAQDGDDAAGAADAAAMASALREDRAEGVRKLYVGVTRAKQACWLSVGKPSSQFKNGVLDWVMPKGVASLLPNADGNIIVMNMPEPTAVQLPPQAAGILPTSRHFTRSLDRDWWVHSFSRLSEGRNLLPLVGVVEEEARADVDASPLALAAGPRGPRFGVAVHAALEHVDFAAWSVPLENVAQAQRIVVERAMKGEGFSAAAAMDAARRMISASLRTPLVDGMCLADLPAAQRRAEMAFHFGMAGADAQALLALLHQHDYQRQRQHFAKVGKRLAGLMTGIIDLVFVHQQRWWIVDYKTNYLGDHASDYAAAKLPAVIAAHDYDLQYLIYSVALHRWLRQVRGADYDYERDFGGIRYLFLRGMGVGPADNGIFACRPPVQLIEAMDRLLHAPGVAA